MEEQVEGENGSIGDGLGEGAYDCGASDITTMVSLGCFPSQSC